MACRSSDSPSVPRDMRRPAPDFGLEAARHRIGDRLVAGVDEVGRGPLAGPVFAAAVILDRGAIPVGLADSKTLSAAERERLNGEILRTAMVSIASASADEVDRLNIRGATLLAMRRAVAGLAARPCHVLIDGHDIAPGLACKGTAVVGGDGLSLSIAAASIVAKVARDALMRRLCAAFPAYGFGRHMGYGTPQHLDALARHGPCRFHRQSFSPIRQRVLALT
ncbi:MAG: ribonuclease HII [Rhizobiaceae bacterium]|nr:ribonuclease HII [Rhizobiaceae bacterium]